MKANVTMTAEFMMSEGAASVAIELTDADPGQVADFVHRLHNSCDEAGITIRALETRTFEPTAREPVGFSVKLGPVQQGKSAPVRGHSTGDFLRAAVTNADADAMVDMLIRAYAKCEV